MRKVIKLILKALALPLIASVMLIQWIGIFLTGLAGGIFGILSFLFALSAGASFLFGISSGAEALKMLAVGFALFYPAPYRRKDHNRDYCHKLQSG